MKNSKGTTLAASALIALLCAGCGIDSKTVSEKNKVEAIYWHERNRYSAAIVRGDTIDMHRIPIFSSSDVTVLQDVPAKEKPWYECEWKYDGFKGNHGGWCNIHIHSVDPLRTADWNHGKFGTGSTKRIQ